MSEELLNEAMQYNLDYTEAMLSDELFGTNEVAEVKLLALEKAIKDLQKEKDGLNNIINELEKYLNQEIIEWQDASDLWTKAQVQEDRIVLDKLKALKENNK